MLDLNYLPDDPINIELIGNVYVAQVVESRKRARENVSDDRRQKVRKIM
jgi:hypothetical protein